MNQRGNYPMANVNYTLNNLERELNLLRKKRQMLEDQMQPLQHQDYDRMPPPSNWNNSTNDRNQMRSFYSTGNSYQGGSGAGNKRFRSRKRPAKEQPQWAAKKPYQGQSQSNNSTPPKPRSDPRPPANEEKEDFLLRKGMVPSGKMAGRLELVLGTVLKDIRTVLSEPPFSVIACSDAVRSIKAELRSRIFEMMVGKQVTNLPAMVKSYRKLYPKKTDADFAKFLNLPNVPVKEAVRTQSVPDVKAPRTFKRLVEARLMAKLDDIFKKIEKLYEEERALEKATGENIVKDDENESDAANANEETLLNTSAENKETDDNPEAGSEEQTNDSADVAVDTDKVADLNNESAPATVAEETAPTDEAASKNETKKFVCDKKLIGKAIAQSLPFILPRYKVYIMKLIYQDKEFMEFIANGERPKPAIDFSLRSPYFLKVIGNPTLPKRPVMQEFLSKFNPNSVKRHRVVPCLLFVGLQTKEDYDALIAASGSKIGDITINVKLTANTANSADNQDAIQNGNENLETNKTDEAVTEAEGADEKADAVNELTEEAELNGEANGSAEIEYTEPIQDESNVFEAEADAIAIEETGNATEELVKEKEKPAVSPKVIPAIVTRTRSSSRLTK